MSGLDVVVELIDPKIAALLRVLFNSKEAFYLRELAKKANLPVTSTLRSLNELAKLNLVKITQIKRMKLYSISDNERTHALASFFRHDIKGLDYFVSSVKQIDGLEAVYVHGLEEKDRANVLLIGEQVDEAILKEAVGIVKERYDFTISYISVTRDQYQQMNAMGLWKGQKRVVWKRKK